MLNNIFRLYHTIKYLKLKQIFWRVFKLFPKFISQTIVYPKNINEKKTSYFIPRKQITNDYNQFTFLNEKYSLGEKGWDNSKISKLWRYNLHYFDYLLSEPDLNKNQLNAQINLIENWIENNTFGNGTGWEPYPTSLRIVNWIKWHWFCGGLSEKAKLSLWNQVKWLAKRPEYHLLGNHLFVNAKALLYASAFFQLDINSIIYKKAISILEKEILEQFLEDGAHFELSPMYHSLAMEDLLDLISLSNSLPNNFPLNLILVKYNKGIAWLHTMVYENLELPHFNDCANAIAPTYNELESYAIKLGIDKNQPQKSNFYYHQKSGFIVYKDHQSHLIADIGKIGPDYLPGHAHADTLSFELAIKGQRFIVNSGTSEYGNSTKRHFQRGTLAHSTIQIDSTNSSDVWSGFRVGKRAVPFNIHLNLKDQINKGITFGASHNGYSKLNSNPIHSRTFNLNNNTWSIYDEISGLGNKIISRFYIHPEIEINIIDKELIFSKNNIDLIQFKNTSKVDFEILDTFYYDNFGVNKPNKCIQIISNSPSKIKIEFQIL